MKQILKIIMAAGLLLCAAAHHEMAFAKEPTTIYFYSSETNVNNYKILKIGFDTFLSQHGNFIFQPFNDQKTFERYFEESPNGVFIVSSWHFRQLKKAAHMKPVLVGAARGSTTQKRTLSAKHTLTSLNMLEGKTIAAAGSEAFARHMLQTMWPDVPGATLEGVRILTVPKDLDALLAVSFGMAKAALTTEGSLVKMKAVNPKQHKELHALATSSDNLLPVVVVHQSLDGITAGLVEALLEMSEDKHGAQSLKILGLDHWQKLTEAEKEALAQ